jgi:hypothetical protein
MANLEQDVPLASAKTPASANGPDDRPRFQLPRPHIFFVGLLLGIVSFVISMAMISRDVPTASAHDLQLANNLGFIYAPFIGMWAGLVRRSLLWTLAGVAVGLALGSLYRWLSGYDFLSVMVAYPCLLGGLAAAALGRGQRSWSDGVLFRLVKGLYSGFVLGFLYMVGLNLLGAFLLPAFDSTTTQYRSMMWVAGTIAMGFSSAVFLVLFHWSANLGPSLPHREKTT